MTLKILGIAGATAAFLSLSFGALTPASAYLACNKEGDCWHTDARPKAPGVRFDLHPDDWYVHQQWEADKERHFRDYHDGRGFYRNGQWVPG